MWPHKYFQFLEAENVAKNEDLGIPPLVCKQTINPPIFCYYVVAHYWWGEQVHLFEIFEFGLCIFSQTLRGMYMHHLHEFTFQECVTSENAKCFFSQTEICFKTEITLSNGLSL